MGWLLMCLMLLPTLAYGKIQWEENVPGGFSARVTIPNEKIDLIDTLTVKIVLDFPKEYAVDEALLRSHLLWGFDPVVNSFALADEQMESSPGHRTITYRLEPLTPGSLTLSFLNIQFNPANQNGKPVTLFSDVFDITVNPMKEPYREVPEPAGLLSLSTYPPMQMNDANRKYFEGKAANEHEAARNIKIIRERTFPLIPAIALLVIALGVSATVWYFMQHWNELRQRTQLSPKQKALKELNQIHKQEKTTYQEYEQSFISLTNTVREFIEEQYAIRAPHLTTQEFLKQALESPQFDDKTKKLLSDFLSQADRVKFAEFHPTQADYDRAEAAAKQFLQ